MSYALDGNRPVAWHCESEGVRGDRSHYTLQLGTPEKPEGWMFEMQTCVPSDPDEKQCVESSLRLIEAAPQLLEMMRCVVAVNPILPLGMIEAVSRLVEKATGEQQ